MNTVEKTSTGITPADLILSHSIRLTSHIMSPVNSHTNSSDTSLSDRMDEWISRQHTLLVVAKETQLQTDQHKVVENDAEITDYPNTHRNSEDDLKTKLSFFFLIFK